jgi:hypothetical protein
VLHYPLRYHILNFWRRIISISCKFNGRAYFEALPEAQANAGPKDGKKGVSRRSAGKSGPVTNCRAFALPEAASLRPPAQL